MIVERKVLNRVKLRLELGVFKLQSQVDAINNEIEQLLAQPEQTEQEPFDWETKKKSYLDEIDRLGMEANKDQEEIDRLTDLLFSKPATYIGKTQWMQVPEPLSEKDICQILIKKEWKGFVDLVRIIEKAHGIGGGDE
jgi:predicted DNA-binding protein (MmcQ/YjbR family)